MHKRNVPDVGWVYEIMNIWKSYTSNNVNCRVKNYLKDDHRSYIRNLPVSSCEKKPWKKKFRQHVVREKKEKPEKFGRALHWYHMRSRVWIPYKPEFFCRLSFRNCISCVYNCDDHPSNNSSLRSSHIWFSFIISSASCHRLITNQFNDLLPSLIDRVLHRYHRGQGFKSRTSLNFFFRLSFLNCVSCV